MLDIRAVAYIAPVSEVAFASIALTIRLVNFADETGLVEGGFRVYNGNSGLLIHQSNSIPVSVAAGVTVDVSALTDFDPPAPADDTYFVLFDGSASNALVPDGIGIHLSKLVFDVKPAPLGPIPAGHAVTHEDTGIDEIDLTNMFGLLADPQTPILHHLEHEAGGSDEISVAGLSGHLADAQDPTDHGNAAHTSTFEDQANKGVAGGYCGLPNPFDLTLPLRADGTAAEPLGLFASIDLLNSAYHPWIVVVLNSVVTSATGSTNHPGIRLIASSSTINSGAAIITSASAFQIGGSEKSDFILRPLSLAATTIRVGFHDTVSFNDATDGCYLEITTVGGVPGTLAGKTANNAVRSTTGTTFLLVTSTWYRLRVAVNANATRVDFYLFDEAGATLWTDNLTTNIPTVAGRETGHGIIATNSGNTSVPLCDIDYMNIHIGRVLVR